MDYRDFIKDQLMAASKIARQHFGKVSSTVKPDDNNQVLTEADIAVGEFLINAIQAHFPDHNVIDEEAGGINKNSSFTWVIDPIEGTSNFAVGSPLYGIMLGLLQDSIPFAGGVITPAFGQLYLAQKDKGATYNGVALKVTKESQLANVLVSYGIDGHPDEHERTINESRVIADIIDKVRNIRNAGCEAFDSMYVASGHYGGRINTTSKIWDNVAPQIICEEAGALWTSISGKPIDYSDPLSRIGQNFTNLVSPKVIHEQLLTIINSRLQD